MTKKPLRPGELFGVSETGGAITGDPEVDPFVVMGEGMRPLPADTDMDRLIAAYDLLGRCGLVDFEVGYDDELPEHIQWFAHADTRQGMRYRVDVRGSAHGAAEALARKVVNGGRCIHCGKVVTLWTLDPKALADADRLRAFCVWTRDGKQWTRGCVNTHADGQRTGEAIRDIAVGKE